ncbi:hypothetical protein [Sodalis ligni]|uniref:Uncharacterized protein n=1 Tax=Sodalis ligni TaxID=2697027 RepID=A0A4R1NQ91_9GAMM|nr:hypothetical protein [Sodalis ligni]TCL06926.1 hypothetical protein EZJ58_5224 [Sodalis ligni]
MCGESNVGHMRQLSKFAMTHSAMGEFVILTTAYIDSLSGVKGLPLEEFPSQTVTIKLGDAKRLLAELKKSIAYIEAGIEPPFSEIVER